MSELPPPTAARRSSLGTAAQILGFLIGLGALAYCIVLVARNEKMRHQVIELSHKPGHLAGMVGLSMLILVFTGLMFRAILKPAAKLPIGDAVAVNSLCTLLGNLPMKVSLVVRVLIHVRRNGIAPGVCVAWMGASAAIVAISVLPPLAATLLLKRLDASWWFATIGGTALLAVVCVLIARWLARPGMWERVTGAMGNLLPPLRWVVRSKFVEGLHAGLVMLASPGAVGQATLWRTADFACGTLRFLIAASAVGATLTIDQAAAADSAYFLIQTAAPTGALGTREAGTIGVLTPIIGDDLPVIVLAVSATEMAANVLLGLAAAAYLRVWTLFEKK